MVKCPKCQSKNLYFDFADGFDWDNQMALVKTTCEDCKAGFSVWVESTEVFGE